MKQVTVKDQYLKVRQGQPSLNATTLPPLAPGTVVTVEDQLYNGDAYNGINTWYKDQGGNFLWSGDVGDGQQVTGAVPSGRCSANRGHYSDDDRCDQRVSAECHIPSRSGQLE